MATIYKNDFPLFSARAEKGKELVYLDSAATAQMPARVFESVRQFQERHRSNVHRGIYPLSEEATAAYEGAREVVRLFLNAQSAKEIIFTRNTTESLNLLAYTLGKSFFKLGDRILVPRAEHHSNFLPWQMLSEEKGVIIDILDYDTEGEMSPEDVFRLIRPETKLVSLSYVSHVLGTIHPIETIGAFLRDRGILFVVDGAQAAAHIPIDVEKLNCDFFAFSGHKMGAPMGIGVLYGREEIFRALPPFMRGGGMIQSVSTQNREWADLPARFEAGTPNVEGAVGLQSAIEYIQSIGFSHIIESDQELSRGLMNAIQSISGGTVFGPHDPRKRAGVVSFSIEEVHPHDYAHLLSEDGVSIRAGHHCAMPLMDHLGLSALGRASVWVYNTMDDIACFQAALERAVKVLRR